MPESLPSEYQPTGFVVGQVKKAHGDTSTDSDNKVEMDPVTGVEMVIFTASSKHKVALSTSPVSYVLQDTVKADLDAHGVLGVAGTQGVSLWPDIWTVSPGKNWPSDFRFTPFQIEVKTTHTEANPLELWSEAPWIPPTGAVARTLVVPSGAVAGQVLAWDGQSLVWTGGGRSSLQIVGAGRPDVTATMDATTRAAVASATVGTAFISTDGPQGAWAWRLRTTGWVCIDGDTGGRKLTVTNSTAAVTGTIIVRRITSQVTVTFAELRTLTTADVNYAGAVPPGFRITDNTNGNSRLSAGIPIFKDGTNVPFSTVRVLAGGDLTIAGNGSIPWGQGNWSTADPWPTTLPGTTTP